MHVFDEFIAAINNVEHMKRTKEVLDWVTEQYTQLTPKIAWKQPMFTNQGTFIIGFSVSKKHLAVSPEREGIKHFAKEISDAGYDNGSNIFRIKWEDNVDYQLMRRLIEYNIQDKIDCKTFWRK